MLAIATTQPAPGTSAGRTEEIRARAVALVGAPRETAVEELLDLADGDRAALAAARDTFVARLHRRSDDYEATLALRLLNEVLPRVGW